MRWSWSAWCKPHHRDQGRRHRPAPADAALRKLGLALSAGGAKGLAHVGVLQVLEENGIEIDAIAGCSMGAYVGALWACGISGTTLEELAAEIQDRKTLWRLADPILPPLSGLFRGERAKRHLMRSIGETRFEDLERRLLIVTFDLDTKERLVLREGSIADAVHASCAMPGIIRPVLLSGHRCADGGVVDPVPISSLEKFADVDVTVAVSVLPSLSEVERFAHDPVLPRSVVPQPIRRLGSLLNRNLNLLAPGNVLDTLRKSVQAAQLRIAEQSCRRAMLCIHPAFELPGLWHDYTNFRHYIDAGRAAAEAALPSLRQLLDPGIPHSHDHESSPHPLLVGERVA